MAGDQGTLAGVVAQPNVERVVDILVDKMVEQTIEIPEIVIIPTKDVSFGFNDFDLTSLGSINYQPISDEIQIAELRTQHKTVLAKAMGAAREERLDDYIIRHLIDRMTLITRPTLTCSINWQGRLLTISRATFPTLRIRRMCASVMERRSLTSSMIRCGITISRPRPGIGLK